MTDQKPEQPPEEASPEQQAIGLIKDAESYRLAALRVQPKGSPEKEVKLLAPAWFLLCHSAELALKAFLLSHGADNSGKKGGLKSHDMRHSLLGLYDLAIQRGYTPPDEDFGELMDWLDPYHYGHVFRYRRTGRLQMAAPWFIAEILDPVIKSIESTVRERYMATRKGKS